MFGLSASETVSIRAIDWTVEYHSSKLLLVSIGMRSVLVADEDSAMLDTLNLIAHKNKAEVNNTQPIETEAD